MNRDALVSAVAEELDVTKKDAGLYVDTVISQVVELTAEEGKLRLHGFGAFEVKERAARKGRNPQTGEELLIEGKNVVTFKPAKQFKELVL